MTTKTLKRPAPPAAAGGSTGIAGLMERRRQSVETAKHDWQSLVKLASSGVELDADQVERLGQVADTLEITDIEAEFHRDVDGWRWVERATADIAAIKAKDWPARFERISREIERLADEQRRLTAERNVGKIELEGVGPMTREIGERQRKHPRLFPDTSN